MSSPNVSSSITLRAGLGLPDLGNITRLAKKNSLEDMVPCTVDELIAKCEATMKNLDQQLRGALNKQETRNGRLKTLSSLSEEITGLGPAPSGDKVDETEAWLAKRTAIYAKIENLKTEHPELAESLDHIKSALNGPAPAASKDANDVISQEMDSIRSENETAMIEIQSIISKRSQALQMTSNMVNSFNETAKALIQNLR